jgi:hypothetical protein
MARRTAFLAAALTGSLLVGCAAESDGDPSSSEAPTPLANAPVNRAGSGAASGGNSNHTGGADERSTVPNPTPGAFGATCSSDAACESSACFLGGHGGFCSVRCTADVDCPQPSSGAPHCNPHGYCRY